MTDDHIPTRFANWIRDTLATTKPPLPLVPLPKRIRRLRKQWERSDSADTDASSKILVKELRSISPDLGEPFIKLVSQLAIDNRFIIEEFPEFPDYSLTRSETELLVRELNEFEFALEHEKKIRAAFLKQLCILIEDLLKCYPADTAGNFTVPLHALIDTPALIQHLLHLFIERFAPNDRTQALAFAATANQLYDNYLATKETKPKDSKLSPDELITTYLAGTPFVEFLSQTLPFEIPDRYLPEHRLVVAATGTGKSQFIQADVYHYLQREKRPSIVIIDSMGRMLPKFERLNIWKDDLIIIDPTDINPPALSIFAQPKRIKSYDANTQAAILSDRIKLFTFFFSALGVDLSGRQSIFFSFAMRLILSIPDASLFHLFRLLQEEPKTAQASEFWPYIERMDEHTRLFFEDRFFKKGFNSEFKGLLSDRIHGITSIPAFARMLTAKENKLDLFEAINSGKTILVNTAKGLLGDLFPIFGRYFIASTLGAAFQRAAMPEPYPLTLLYVDEASEYMQDKTLAELFTKARQFNLGALVAYQSLSQLGDLRSDILGNTSTKLISGLEPKEASDIDESLRTTQRFLLSLQKKDKEFSEFACYVKGYTPSAVRLTIPFGVIENAPK